MAQIRVAKRYAAALMALSEEQKDPTAVARDLQTVRAAIAGSRDLRRLLESPVIPARMKKAALAEVFRKKVGPVTRQYIETMVDKRREDVLPEILDQFFLLRDEKLGIVAVDVAAPVKLTAAQMQNLTKQLESYTSKKVRVTFSIDRSLKGGFLARVGDTVFDGTVRRQLEMLRQQLKEGSPGAN